MRKSKITTGGVLSLWFYLYDISNGRGLTKVKMRRLCMRLRGYGVGEFSIIMCTNAYPRESFQFHAAFRWRMIRIRLVYVTICGAGG